MLSVRDVRAALESAPKDAVVYLPGGSPARSVDVRPDGVFFVGDEEARGTEDERRRVEQIKSQLTAGGIAHPDPGHIEKLAWDLLLTSQSSVPAGNGDGNVTLTPSTGSLEAAGQSPGGEG